MVFYYHYSYQNRPLKKKTIIGRRDKADLKKLGLENIDIKVDTGAYTSAIHCRKIEKKKKDGQYVLCFSLLDPTHKLYNNQIFEETNFTEKRIKNSFGTVEKRYVIKSSITIFGKTYVINLSLSERGEMRFPILIGRKFLVGKFIVDPSKTDLSYQKKLKTE